MIAVILDSNTLYGDPFFLGPTLKRMLQYAATDEIDILLSSVVKQETINNNQIKLLDYIDQVNRLSRKVEKGLGTQSIVKNDIDIDRNKRDLEKRFEELEAQEKIVPIELSNDLLPELVRRAVYKIMPFSQNREEFRDCLIWLSCVEYLKSKKYANTFLITANRKDYCAANGSIHSDLEQDYKGVVIYENINRMLEQEHELFASLIPKDASEDLLEWLSENKVAEFDVFDSLTYHFRDNIQERFLTEISNIDASEVLSYPSTGHVHFKGANACDDIQLVNYRTDIDIESVIVSGDFLIDVYVDVYEYNANHHSPKDKYLFVNEERLKVTLGFIYSISPKEVFPFDFEITDVKIVFD